MHGSLLPRRVPTQARARALVDALVEATARVVVEDGYDGATTKRIAEVAGVSVGSLYQYFPGKDALVFALARSHAEAVLADLRVEARPGRPLAETLAALVAGLVRAHQMDARLHGALVQHAQRWDLARTGDLHAEAIGIVRTWLGSLTPPPAVPDLDRAAWMTVHIAESAVHAAVAAPREALDDPGFAPELVLVLRRYLGDATS